MMPRPNYRVELEKFALQFVFLFAVGFTVASLVMAAFGNITGISVNTNPCRVETQWVRWGQPRLPALRSLLEF